MIESKHNPFVSVTQLFDPYGRQARLYPALIAIFPVALLIDAWFPALWSTWGALVSLASSCGLVLLLSQIARDRGKRREGDLYKAWGGKPSMVLLRHSDLRIDDHTKARYRAFLQAQLPKLALPTAEEERADPERGDMAYESVTAWLLTQTRDTKIFSILFRENISYGFRRNLWGLKPLGVAIAIVATCVSTTVIVYQYLMGHSVPAPEVLTVTALVWLLVIFWFAVVSPSWVRLPADAYGMQLLAACDTLNSSKAAKGRTTKV